MIVSRTPFRISFLGGGTDLPAFFREEEGVVVSATIDKYVHVVVKDGFDSTFRLSHSAIESVERIEDIEHKLVRCVLSRYAEKAMKRNGGRGLEMHSMSDIPAGTGLGSSSSFTVGLLNAMRNHVGEEPTAEELAQEACNIEIEEFHEPIGKQDQYVAAYGGLQHLRFLPSGGVTVEKIQCAPGVEKTLEESMLLFYTGITRPATRILKERETNTAEKRAALREMRAMADQLKALLEAGCGTRELGELMHEGWLLKKTFASGITISKIDEWYDRARAAGAIGGKIVGAGGGGFLMVVCEPEKHETVRQELRELQQVPIALEPSGSRIIYAG
jgi:D-glycero-alpha-D-manno-heptose-7-phosphate kinase